MQKEYKGSEKSVKTKKVRIGVFGGGRGISMIEFCTFYDEAELVAICDMNEKVLEDCRKFLKKYDKDKQYYLVVYDEETGLEKWRHPVIMDLAFADDFGFGF